MQKFIVAALLTSLAFVAGCANDLSKGKRNQNAVTAQLAKMPLSPELTSSFLLDHCDEGAAVAVFDRDINASSQHAPEMWDACQRIYACSPTTVEFLRHEFQSGATLRIGYADLKKLKVPKLGNKVGGIYMPGTQNIYLDVNLNTPRQACHMLLHELVHRFDARSYEGEESLKTEYRSYWYQTAFSDDLLKSTGHLGDNVRSHTSASVPAGGVGDGNIIPFHTRESLLKSISDMYGFPMDSSIIGKYAKLPREP